MSDRRASLLLLDVLLLTQVVLAQTGPTLSFPINSQVPPVARIGELLSFTFSSSTFTTSTFSGDNPPLSYTLENDPPSWLSLDSGNRRLYGTPKDDEVDFGTVVGIAFTLVAADSTGSTASDNVTLVVSRNAAPTIQVPLTEQIQSFGNYSEPSSILYRPDTDFNFTFAEDTFSDPSVSDLTYYAISSNDDSPLPSWISFDADSLSFTGTTPPFSSLVEPPQTFSLKLIASDVVGFSGVSIELSIVVGSHTLSANETNIALNVTAGSLFSYDGLVGDITLDGAPASPSDVNATAENFPSWLSFDQFSWNITGNAPIAANSTSFNIIFEDEHSDRLNVTVDLEVLGNGSIFSSAFPTLSVEPGKHLSFDLAPYLLDSSDIDVTADIEPATSWLSWDTSSLSLSGDVPSSAAKSIIDVIFTVSTGDGGSNSNKARKRAGSSQSQKLIIQIESSTTTSSQTATSTATSSASSSATPATSSSNGSGHNVPAWIIIVIVLCIVLGLAIVLGLCYYCCLRRKKRQLRSSLDDNGGPSTVHRDYLSTPGVTILGGIGTTHGSPETEKTTKTFPAAAALQRNSISPNEKEKRNKLRKSSLLRAEASRPESQVLPPSMTLVTSHDGADRSEISTPASRLKDWFASIRSFRVVTIRRPNPRFSESNMSDDSYHHDLDLDPGLSFTRSGIFSSLRTSSRDSSFRSDVEVGVPMFGAVDRDGDSQHSRQQTPPEMSPSYHKKRSNHSGSDKRRSKKGKRREATPLIPRPLGPTPEGARHRHEMDSAIRHSGAGGDPFTDSPILGLMTPDIILTSPDTEAGPSTLGLRQTTSENANLQQLLEHSHPYEAYPPPQRRAVTSSYFPSRSNQRRSLRPARSQVSFAERPASIHNSISSVDSMRSRTRRFARKASSHAKGAVSLASMALGQPKRRTLAALRKNPHLSLRSSKKSIRAIFVNADSAGGADEGNVGDIYSPAAISNSSRIGRRVRKSSSRKGISGLLNPRIWPQPARTVSAPSGSPSTMPWPPTPEVPPRRSSSQGQVRASTSSKAQASTIYSNPSRWKPVGKKPRASSSRSRLGSPRSNNSSSRGSVWSQTRHRRPRASTSRSKLSSSAGGSGSGRLNGHSFRSFRMQQPQLPIRRRPVGAPERERATPQSTYSTVPGGGSSTIGGGGGGGFPSPLPSLPSPILESGGGMGLGISTYEDIISSSPFHPSRGDHASRRSSWTTISGSARGGDHSHSNNNNNTSSSGDALDSSSGTLPNWIVFGRAEDLNLNALSNNRFQDDEQEQEDDSWFVGLDATGNRLPNRESPIIRSPLDWRRFGPSSSSPSPSPMSPPPDSSVERGRGEGSSRGHARRSMFLGGGGVSGFGTGGAGGGTRGGLRIVNPGTQDSLVSGSGSGNGSVKASATAQSNMVSEGATSSGRRVFL